LITEFIIFKDMFVCVCRAVTEERVKAAIDSGARSVEAVTAACHAGDDCRACHCLIDDLIDERWGASDMPPAAVRLPVAPGRAA
jgi:bacterioferritin-associated ferredoxin